jgi:hypothetical protein
MRHLIEQWFRPYPNLGFHMVCGGVALLMVSLILNRLFPDPISYGYVVGCWAIWLIGALLVIAGSARIFAMLDE